MISIIIPSFNQLYYLEKLIERIINQTYKNWELIIVDDLSTDNTANVINNNYADIDKRIKIFTRNRSPKGAQTCRNIGLGKAVGQYIVFFDADDLISLECLQNRFEYMNRNPRLDFGIFHAITFKDNFVDGQRIYGKEYGINKKVDLIGNFLKADYPFTVWTNVFKTNFIKKYLWDEKVEVYQDFDYLMSILLTDEVRYEFSNLPIDYYYRKDGNKTISSSFVSKSKNKSTIYLFSKTLNLLKNRKDYNKRKKQFLMFIILHFERLVLDGDKLKMYDYLTFCKKYYSGFLISNLQIIFKVSLIFRTQKVRKGTLFLFLTMRFGYKRYYKSLLNQLRLL